MLSLHFNGIYQDNLNKPVLESLIQDFTRAKDEGGGGDTWSYKTCKVRVKMSPSANQHPVFHRPDALPVAQPTVSQH